MRQYRSIQYLRGLAAMMVVAFHLGAPLERLGWRGGWPSGLSSGVDIFFVISGFVMWLTTRDRAIGPVQFWLKRILRIVPLYWLVTSFMLAVLLIAPSVMQTSRFEAYHVAASYLFFPALNPGKPAMQPLVLPGWTLNYEMFFYLIFGLFLLAKPAVRLIGTIAVLLALVTAGQVLQVRELSVAGFYTSDIMLEFGFGMVIGEVLHRRNGEAMLPSWAAIALLVAGLAALFIDRSGFPAVAWVLVYGVGAAAVVLGALSLDLRGKVREIRLAHLVGDASYSIYLTQLISMAAIFAAWRKLAFPSSPASLAVFAVVDCVGALITGLGCYLVIERPLLRFLTRPGKK